MDFSYKIGEKEKHRIIHLNGNLIEKNQAAKLMEEVNTLISKGVNRFVLNLSGFKYMNSTGLTVLLNILTIARKAGGETVICCVPAKIQDILSITKLNSIFTVADTEKHALDSLN